MSNPRKMIKERLEKLEKQEILREVKRIAREKIETEKIEILKKIKNN